MNNFGYDWTGHSQQRAQPGCQQPPLPTVQGAGLNQNRLAYPPLQGHEIQAEEDILPKDVPMDGSAGWFPAQNLQFVVMRRWNKQGTFDTVLYVPYQPEAPQKQPESSTSLDDFMAAINARFDKIEKVLTKPRHYPKNNQKPKEETVT